MENDLEDRKTNETIFYFPFDKKNMPPEKAYSDILEKLKRLVFPTLFLSNLKEVSWKTENESGEYLQKKEIIKKHNDIGLKTANKTLIC